MKDLTRKLTRKVVTWLEEAVPHNSHLKPKGAYERTADYILANPGTKVHNHVIFSNYRAELPISEHLFKSLSPYFTYDRIEQRQDGKHFVTESDYVVAQVPGGRILTNNVSLVAVITADGYLLGDVSYQYSSKRSLKASENAVFERSWFSEPKRYKGTVLNMLAGGGSTYNYGHWLVDALPRLHLADMAGLLDQIDYVLVPTYQHDYHRDTLALFGFGPEKVIIADDNTHIQADQIISTSHPRGNRSYLVPEWLIEMHRKRFLTPTALIKAQYPELIYISRKDSDLRRVINEDELMSRLAPLGFKSFQLAKLPFTEKVALMANARVVISASGAGMNNIMFCREGFTFFEIFPEGLVHTQFYNIAHFLGASYDYMVCPARQPATKLEDGLKEHTYVEVEEFMRKVHVLLESNTLKTIAR